MSNTDFDPAAFIQSTNPTDQAPATPTQPTEFDPAKFLASSQGTQPAATTPATPVTPHQRLHAVQQGMASESATTPAGWGSPDVVKTPIDAPTSDDLIRMWKDVGKGLPEGLASAVTGGIAGDFEGAIRQLLAPYGASQQTYLPTSVEGGPVLGQRGLGLNVFPPAETPERAGGRQLGSMMLPFMPSWIRAASKTLDRPVPFGARPEPTVAPPEAPNLATPRVDARGQRTSPDLIPPETPHTLPATASAGAQTISPLTDIDPMAIQQVHNSLTEAGFTSGTLEQRLEEMSPHEFGFEVGGPHAAPYRSANGIIQVGGQGGQDVASAMMQRRLEAPERVNNLLDDAVGTKEDLSTLNRVERIDQQKASNPLYQQFKALRIQPTQAIKDLIPRLNAAGAFGTARQLARLQNIPWNQRFFTSGLEKEFPTAESWNMVKQALDAKIEGSLGEFGRRTIWTRQYMDIKSKLLDAIDNHPDKNIAGVWKQARDTFADTEQIQSARRLGQKLLSESIDADEVPYMTAGFSEPQMASLRQGLRKYLADKAGRPGAQDPQIVKQLLGPNNQSKLRWVLRDGKADELIKGLNHEQDMYASPRAPLYGSPTMRNSVDAAQWQAQPSSLQSTIGTIGQFAKHPVGTMAGGAMDRVHQFLNKAAEARMARIRDDAAKIYTMQGPVRDAVYQWILDHGADYARQRSLYARGGAVREPHRQSGGAIENDEATAPPAHRGVMDQLLGTTGPRYQTWPEKVVRGVAGTALRGATLPGDVMAGRTTPDDPSYYTRATDLASTALVGATSAVPESAEAATGLLSRALQNADEIPAAMVTSKAKQPEKAQADRMIGFQEGGAVDPGTDEWAQYINPETGRPRITIGPSNAPKTVPGADDAPPPTPDATPPEKPPQTSPSEAETEPTGGPTPEHRGVIDQLLGLTGPRFQTWPERMIRSGATLAHDVAAGEIPYQAGLPAPYVLEDPTTGRTSEEVIERAQDMAALAGGAGAGAAEEGAVGMAGGKPPPGWRTIEGGVKEPKTYDEAVAKQTGQPVPEPSQQMTVHQVYTPQEMMKRGEQFNIPDPSKLTISRSRTIGDNPQDVFFVNQPRGVTDPAFANWPNYTDVVTGFYTKAEAENFIKSQQRQTRPADWTGPKIYSDTSKPGVALAALKNEPLYSAAEKAVQGAKQNKATAEQWVDWLKNQPGIKPEEIDQLGLSTLFGPPVRTAEGSIVEGPITKDQLLQHIGDNKTQLNEKWFGGTSKPKLSNDEADELRTLLNQDDRAQAGNAAPLNDTQEARLNELQSIAGPAKSLSELPPPPRFPDYQMPRGENYRELLLKMPAPKPMTRNLEARPAMDGDGYAIWEGDRQVSSSGYSRSGAQESAKELSKGNQPVGFQTRHWPDDPNTLLHLRMNDRKIPGVGDSLHLEEVQSDWHQVGRKRGYGPNARGQATPGTEAGTVTPELTRGATEAIRGHLDYFNEHPDDYKYEVKYDHPIGTGLTGAGGTGHMYDLIVKPKVKLADPSNFRNALDDLTHTEHGMFHIGGREYHLGDGDDPGAVRYDDQGNAHIWLRTFAENNPVPDAPFKNTNDWAALGLKRAIVQAAREGKDAISWTPGQQQADRYDLSKHIDSIRPTKNNNGTFDIDFIRKGSTSREGLANNVPPDKLADHVGKDLAGKILEDDKSGRLKWYKGLDLKVGGQGIKKFYDELLPNVANKIGKKYGAKVEWKSLSGRDKDFLSGDEAMNRMAGKPGWTDIPRDPDARGDWFRDLPRDLREKLFDEARNIDAKVPILRLTPQLKEQALKGMPLFSDTSKPGRMLAALNSMDQEYLDRWHGGGEGDPTLRRSNAFTKTLEKFPTYKGTVYRGLTLPATREGDLVVGKTFELAGHASSSKLMKTGKQYEYAGRHNTPTLWEIKQQSGRDTTAAGGPSGEHEVVLPKGTKYQITKVSQLPGYEEGGAFKIEAKEVPASTKVSKDQKSLFAGGGAVKGEQEAFSSTGNTNQSGATANSAFARGGRVIAKNINHNPTPAQKEAGNYAKDHVKIHGLDIAIENAKGSTRKGVGKDGKAWKSILPAHYGYIKRTEGSDGDHVDVYLGPHIKSTKVWVIDQIDHGSKAFDEHKVMLGFGAKQQAINTYQKGFSDGKGKDRIGSIKEMSIEQFKTWLKGDTTQPVKKGGITPTTSEKITRGAFIYLPPKKGVEKTFAQCGPCRMFVGNEFLPKGFKGGRCVIHGSKVAIDAGDSCGFMVPWPTPDGKLVRHVVEDHAKELARGIPGSVTPEQSGLISSQVRCENCKYTSGDPEHGCGLYRMLNQRQPEDFDLDPEIESHGCCNAWTSRTK